jgi:hypothetical protein
MNFKEWSQALSAALIFIGLKVHYQKQGTEFTTLQRKHSTQN